MPNFAARFSFSAVVLLGLSIGVASQTPPRPLRASEVLALEAGGVLPANVAHEIDVRGLNFHPDEDYRALLNTSGGRCDRIGGVERSQGDGAGWGWEAGQGIADAAQRRSCPHQRQAI